MDLGRHDSGARRHRGKTPDGFHHQGPDAPSAHRRPGYPLSGCVPAEPDSVSPGSVRLASTQQCGKPPSDTGVMPQKILLYRFPTEKWPKVTYSVARRALSSSSRREVSSSPGATCGKIEPVRFETTVRTVRRGGRRPGLPVGRDADRFRIELAAFVPEKVGARTLGVAAGNDGEEPVLGPTVRC